jgi:hypothetical protein
MDQNAVIKCNSYLVELRGYFTRYNYISLYIILFVYNIRVILSPQFCYYILKSLFLHDVRTYLSHYFAIW